MKFWLIVMFFNVNGDFIKKVEIQVRDRPACERLQTKYVNLRGAISYCVSNDHHTGKKYDKNIPLDLD